MKTTISHLSVAVKDPKRTAEALAALTDGKVEPFHPVEGGYVCLWGGWEGQFVELYPLGTRLVITGEGADFDRVAAKGGPGPVHLNLKVSKTGAEVTALAKKFGYPSHFRPKHGGPLHEVWIDGELLIELVTSDL